jgi:hypothetical protein
MYSQWRVMYEVEERYHRIRILMIRRLCSSLYSNPLGGKKKKSEGNWSANFDNLSKAKSQECQPQGVGYYVPFTLAWSIFIFLPF